MGARRRPPCLALDDDDGENRKPRGRPPKPLVLTAGEGGWAMSAKTKIGDPEWVYGTLLRRGWLEYRCTIVRALVQSWEETDLEEGKARKPIKHRRNACKVTPFPAR